MARDNNATPFEAIMREEVSLAPLTTLQVGGAARFFAEVHSAEQMLAGIRWAAGRAIPVFVLGGGSNIVVSDRGFAGLVLRNAITGIELRDGEDDSKLLTAGAGDQWDDVVKLAVANNLSGVECLSGIPGSVGATPIQNVGAYGQEIRETMVALDAIDTTSGAIVTIGSNECGFGYRTSRFKTIDAGRFVIIRVTYRLLYNGSPTIKYADVGRYLEERGRDKPGLGEVREAVLSIRRAKAMVIDPGDPDSRSVGSFFVNPVVTLEQVAEIERRFAGNQQSPGRIRSFAGPGGMVKLSAAWLIEQSGFVKGYQYGGVGLSSKHSLAIVARSGGTASEVMELARKIQARVRAETGVQLTPEPTFVGRE